MSIEYYVETKVQDIRTIPEIDRTVLELRTPERRTLFYTLPFCIGLRPGDKLVFKNPNFSTPTFGPKVLGHEDYERVRIYDSGDLSERTRRPVYCEFRAKEFLD